MRADAAEVSRACDRLEAARRGLIARSWRDIARVLGTVGGRFLAESDPLRDEVLARLPQEAGLSPEMAEAVLLGMASDWTADRLIQLVREEFVEPACLDASTEVDGREVMAVGPALCVQIVSGSVPGVGVNALVRSLLVKGPTLIKPGRGDVVLTELFARALEEHDAEIAAALEVVYWSGGEDGPMREALRRADVVTVYGSDQTVSEVRSAAPATTRVVGYHHREGVAVIGREVMTVEAGPDAAARTARAVAMFEQRGCVCPHVVHVEEGGELSAAAFAELLSDALRDLESELPSPAPLPEEGAAIQQLRGMAELASATGGGSLQHGGRDATWTVVYEEESLDGAPVTLARGVRVRPIEDAAALSRVLAPDGRHLQSVGYAGLDARVSTIAAELGRAGASRVVPLERISFPAPWWLHDGRGPLREIVRWVEVER